MAIGYGADGEQSLQRMMQILNEWREPNPPALLAVPPQFVCPDQSNREYTLLSIDHVHFLAQRMAVEGFQTRQLGTNIGHGASETDSEIAFGFWHFTTPTEYCASISFNG